MLNSDQNSAARIGAIRRGATQTILHAAEAVFARHGLAGSTMAEIAQEAGLPKANLHYYFGTKDRLYQAVLEGIVGEWLDHEALWITPERHPAEGLAGYIRAKMLHARRRPDASRIWAGELLRGAPVIMGYLCQTARQQVLGTARVLAGWSEAGLMDRIAPTHLLFTIWGMTQTYADFDVQIRSTLGTSEISDTEFETAIQTVTNLVLKGCGVKDRAPGRY
jgi:TetR/AcrR family transcriptional regulator